MKLSQFKFNLPSELIALQPTQNRDEARLMVVDRRTGKIEHRVFKDLVDYVKDGDVFVINNTKVFPAKLYGEKEKTGAKIEVLLLRELDHESRLWDVLVDPARKIRIGNKLYFGDGDELVAEVIDNRRFSSHCWHALQQDPDETPRDCGCLFRRADPAPRHGQLPRH